jgi:2-methylcitrate dehydratase PrpD
MEHASGEEVLSAVTLGVEVGGRIGVLALQQGLTRGFLPASVVGGFGATASACRLLGFDVDQTVNALGIYYAQTSGNRQALLDHTLTKRMQPAYSARSALWSACLAKRGVTGAHNAMEGNAGFFRVYARSEPPDVAEVAGLRDSFQIEQLWIKQYPSCGGVHRSTQAAIDLAQREDLQVADIKDVDLYVGENGIWFVGRPFEVRQHPQVDAQFSAAYGVALGLVHRQAGLAQYATESILSDETVLDIASRVRIHEIEGTKGKRTDLVPVTVEVTTHDGRTLSSTALELKGSPDSPMTYAEVSDKFRECASYADVWSKEAVVGMISAVAGLEAVEDVARFVGDMLVSEGVE